jgi:hypothetical protein
MAEGPAQIGPTKASPADAPARGLDAITAVWAGRFGAGLTVAALAAFLLVMVLSPTDSLGFAALAGTAILSVGLIALIILSRAVGITEPNAALGLPHGSIRALLALGLAIVFVAVASWTLGGLFDPLGPLVTQVTVPSKDVANYRTWYPNSDYIFSETQLAGPAKSQGAQPAAGAPDATRPSADADAMVSLKIYLKRRAQDPNVFDLAKQILTISATVLVTVVGFYFGSNSAAEATRALKDTMGRPGTETAGAPDLPIKPDDLRKTTNAIASIAAATQSKLQGLGNDPIAPLVAAVKGADVKGELATKLAAAQAALNALKKQASACASDAERANVAAASVHPDATPAQLKEISDRLQQLLNDATQANHGFEQKWTEFSDARNFILQKTAQG